MSSPSSLALLLVLLTVIQQCRGGFEFSVMSYNVRTSAANDGGDGNWAVRKDRCVEVANKYSPDLIGMQEVSPEQHGYFKSQWIRSFNGFGRDRDGDGSSEYVPIFYRTNQWTLLGEGTFFLNDHPDTPGNTWGLMHPRAATWGRFRHEASQTQVCMFNNHFDTNAEKAVRSAQLVLDKIRQFCTGEDILIVTGDLNVPQYHPGIKEFENSNFEQSIVDNGYYPGTFSGTFTGGVGDSKIDYVLYTPREDLCVAGMEVIREKINGGYPSDHALVQTRFCKGRDCACNGGSSTTTTEPTSTDTPPTSTPTPDTAEPEITATPSDEPTGSIDTDSPDSGKGDTDVDDENSSSIAPSVSPNTNAADEDIVADPQTPYVNVDKSPSDFPTEVNSDSTEIDAVTKQESTNSFATTGFPIIVAATVIIAAAGFMVVKKRKQKTYNEKELMDIVVLSMYSRPSVLPPPVSIQSQPLTPIHKISILECSKDSF